MILTVAYLLAISNKCIAETTLGNCQSCDCAKSFDSLVEVISDQKSIQDKPSLIELQVLLNHIGIVHIDHKLHSSASLTAYY